MIQEFETTVSRMHIFEYSYEFDCDDKEYIMDMAMVYKWNAGDTDMGPGIAAITNIGTKTGLTTTTHK